MTVYFTIGIEPRTKKNSSRIVRGRLLPSAAYEQYEKDCMVYLRPCPVREPITYPVNVKALYYLKPFKNGKHRKVDISNLHSALHDVLVEYGVLADDKSDIVAGTDGSRVRWDADNPRTEVTIEEMDDLTAKEKAQADFETFVLEKLHYWYKLSMRMGDAITAIVRGGIVAGKEMDELSEIYMKHWMENWTQQQEEDMAEVDNA